MRFATLLTFVFSILVVGAARGDDKSDKKALEKLQGTYKIIGFEQEGMKLTEEDLKKVPDTKILNVVIKGDELQSQFTKEGKATIQLDTSKKPPHLDVITTVNGKKLVDYGIYSFENNVLTICMVPNSKPEDRPTDFKLTKKTLILKMKKQPAK